MTNFDVIEAYIQDFTVWKKYDGKDGVSYQTKASYNGNVIHYHSDQADNGDMLVIGSVKDSLGNQCFIGCHSDILIFNRTLTEYEISWVKNNIMCSKQQEPDIDL